MKKREFCIAIIGLLIGVISLVLAIKTEPNVSMESPLDPDSVLTTPFVISNDGPLSIENVKVAILVKGFRDSRNNTIGVGVSDWGITEMSREMKPGDRKTIPSPFQRLVMTVNPVVGGRFALVISFRPAYFPFWQKRRAFLFTIARQADGRSRFEQQPAENILDEYEAARLRQ